MGIGQIHIALLFSFFTLYISWMNFILFSIYLIFFFKKRNITLSTGFGLWRIKAQPLSFELLVSAFLPTAVDVETLGLMSSLLYLVSSVDAASCWAPLPLGGGRALQAPRVFTFAFFLEWGAVLC